MTDVVNDPEKIRQILTDTFKKKSRGEWMSALGDIDACVSPVLELDEVSVDPHNSSKRSFVVGAIGHEPTPAPRLSRTPARTEFADVKSGQNSREILRELNFADKEIEDFLRRRVVETDDAEPNSKL